MIILCFALMFGQVEKETHSLTISGPAQRQVGSLTVLRAAFEEKHDDVIYTWIVQPVTYGVDQYGVPQERSVDISSEFLPIDDSIIFATGITGKYKFILVASYYEDGKVKAVTSNHVLEIVQNQENQSNQNEQTGEPDQLLDNELAKVVNEWVVRNVQLPSAQLIQSSNALANSFTEIAKEITDGKLPNKQSNVPWNDQIMAALAVKNTAAVGQHVAAWKLWDEVYSSMLASLIASGKLRTPNDYVEVFHQTSVGLRAIK